MILAIDIGTTFLKSGVVGFDGKLTYMNRIKASIDPQDWVNGFQDLVNAIPEEILEEIIAVVISGNGPTIIPVDSQGNSIAHANLWSSVMPEETVEDFREIIGESIPPNFFLGKIYSIFRNEKSIYKTTAYFLGAPEFLSTAITGEFHTTLPSEGFRKFYWDNDKVINLKLDGNKLPGFISPESRYGHYNGKLGVKGLKTGIPVFCSGPDYLMSILGSGSVEEGIVCDRTGTSEGLNYCSNSEINIEGLRTLPHPVSGMYTISGLIPKSGDYVMNNQRDKLLAEFKSVIEKMMDAGLKVNEIRIIGGHSSFDNLNREKALALPVPLRVYPEGSELLGNGVLGSVTTGIYKDIKTACKYMVKERVCFNV